MGDLKFGCLFPVQPAAQEDPEQRPIALTLERVGSGTCQQCPCLVRCEPVPQTDAEVLWTFDLPDAGGKVRGEQAGVSSFICEAPNGDEPAVSCARRKPTRFHVNSIAGDNGLVYGVPVASLGFLRGQAIENRRFCLIEVRQVQGVLRGRRTAFAAFGTFHQSGASMSPQSGRGNAPQYTAASNGFTSRLQ
jgi:hypothetical protein